MSDNPLQDRFDVVVEGATYTFRKPTIRYDIEVGYKSADIRNRAYPDGYGGMGGIDMQAVNFSRYCAILEMYLLSATVGWPFGITDEDLKGLDTSKAPKVDFDKFPLDSADDVYAVGQAFEAAVQRFRSRGNKSGAPAGA